jgi:hypothetical protein
MEGEFGELLEYTSNKAKRIALSCHSVTVRIFVSLCRNFSVNEVVRVAMMLEAFHRKLVN